MDGTFNYNPYCYMTFNLYAKDSKTGKEDKIYTQTWTHDVDGCPPEYKTGKHGSILKSATIADGKVIVKLERHTEAGAADVQEEFSIQDLHDKFLQKEKAKAESKK
eukprot:CAMPEP_0167760554 /NCGR_PEP_ID=MMETSP0110_2-20121227/11651_1 /TAXON_ID=629695 /ORGANISM="Gymnochlora sp., Strain CCMP2014" /LENGTH=105 /DNA_ID=CAMNT_0007647079 /DNA_START=27 /DNA_END=344 /DNA_ORIENTATION=-